MRIAVGSLLLLVLLAGPVAGESKIEKEIWLAVGAVELTDQLAPLVRVRAHRYDVRIAKPPVADALKALGRAPAFLLLVGDYEPGKDDEFWQLPPMRRPLYKWRKPQRAEFSSDSLYGDTDGDLMPDFPVGRFPVRTPEEVQALVRKTIAHGWRAAFSSRPCLLAWAGAPGYGGTIDAMATGMLVSTVRRYAPVWADRFLISGNVNSPLCGWPPDQVATFNEQWRNGAVLAAFVAHASDRAVLSMRHEGKSILYTQASAREGLTGKGPVAPAVFLTCYSGEFDDGNECLAETMLKLPGGPAAVIAATTESHPLTNLFTGRAMLKELARGERRLGTLWLNAQREGATMRDFIMESMLKDVEGKLEDKIDVAKLRRDQPLIYAILGDPALRLAVPSDLEMEIEKTEKGWRYSVPKLDGATGLKVEFRAPPQLGNSRKGAAAGDADAARKHQATANALEAYATIRELGPKEEWTGLLTKPGEYRFTRGQGVSVRVHAVKLP